MKFYEHTQLHRFSNGMEAYVLPSSGGTVMAECYIKTGSIHEEKDLGCGLSHFLEHMLFQGCQGFPGTQAADTLQQNGCSVNAYTSFDRTVYHARGSLEKLDLILEVLSSMIRYPELPQKRFEAEREVILREYDRGQDDPGRRLQQELFRLMYLHHPLRVPVIGQRNLIENVTREMAWDYHQRRYTPGRCFWVITGNADPQKVFDILEKRLGDWPGSHLAPLPLPPAEPRQFAPRNGEFVFSDAVSRLAIGLRLPSDLHLQMPAYDILFGLLGMGAGSRLNRQFELEKKLALGLRTFCYTLPGGGAAGVSAVCSPAKLNILEKELRKELEATAAGKITADEIRREKNQQYAEHLRQLEDLEHVSAIIGAGVMECGNPEMGDIYQKQLETTTPEQVIEAARTTLESSQFCIVKQLTSAPRKKVCATGQTTNTPVLVAPVKNVPLQCLPARNIPLVHFSLVLPGGTLFETTAQAGKAKMLQALLGAGTRHHSESAILTALDKCGADLGMHTGYNSLIIELDAPRKNMPQALGLLSEILAESTFSQEVFDREKQRLFEMLASRQTAAAETAFDRARQLLFGNHPYSSGLGGTAAGFKNLTPGDVSDFYTQALNSKLAAAGFSGDLSEKEAETWGHSVLDALPWHDCNATFPAEPVFPAQPVNEIISLEREQMAVVAAVPGKKLSDTENQLIFQILSNAENGLSAKLFKRVREDNALAYSVGMDLSGGFHRGWLAFYAQTRCDKKDAALQLLLEEINRLADCGLDPEELESARAQTEFKLRRKQDSAAGRLSSLLLELFYDRNAHLDSEKEFEILNSLSLDKVNSRLAETFANSIPVTVCAGKTQ